MKHFVGIIATIGFWLQACGTNTGTSLPESREARSSDVTAPTDGELLDLAAKSRWRGELLWTVPPSFQHDRLVEVSGHIYLQNSAGGYPTTVTNVKLRASLPELGQGTGNVLPKVFEDLDQPGHFTFSNVFFAMTGLWRLQISATVDGSPDRLYRMIEVK
jgi:hypothetical protein